MAQDTEPTVLASVRRALALGDMPSLRDAILSMTDDDRQALAQRLGDRAVRRLMANSRRVRRGTRGRVVMIHGIMGGKLASVSTAGDQDLVWVNYLRLCMGRIEDFTLDANANPTDPSCRIVTCGLLDEYLPMVSELDGEWEVLPFAFDWRLDIDDSARRLNDAIVSWAGGSPVHIVAHSMGGLVARRFIQLYTDTWKSMADAQGLRRGGRLVMLGTPNRGSFAIPFVLTGAEKTVRMLERFDLKHDMDELLAIINTFVGSYQMLPTPRLPFGDDRLQLYKQPAWGKYPVAQPNLDRGRKFQESMDDVLSSERLLYVAGYDQPTPYRVRVDGPGDFSYQETLNGDGRVPHELGLLPSVKTFYVREKHGDLPRNDFVLASIHDLLREGATTGLGAEMPINRSVTHSAVWRKAEELAPIPPAVDAIFPSAGGRRGPKDLTPAERATLESAFVEDLVGAPRGVPASGASASVSVPAAPQPRSTPAVLKIEVVWGDICKVDGDIYAAGHYRGVLPQRAELALDRVVSASDSKTQSDPDSLVITSLTRRGVLRGAVGDVNFFPWPNPGKKQKTVAIAGMGYPGTFSRPQLIRLAHSLTNAVTALPNVATVNMVLIGSGVGSLLVRAALEGLLEGMIESFDGGSHKSHVRKLRIVEIERTQAQKILDTLKTIPRASATLGTVALDIAPTVISGAGGIVTEDLALSAFLVLAARAHSNKRTTRVGAAVKTLLSGLRSTPELRLRCEAALAGLGRDTNVDSLEAAAKFAFSRAQEPGGSNPIPTRISFIGADSGIRAAALTNTAVVPERFIPLDWRLIEELIREMTDPADPAKIAGLSLLLARFMIPRDFREQCGSSEAIIFEVDRKTARIHWEMLGLLRDQPGTAAPMALKSLVARQLRTTYSAPPSQRVERSSPLRALVIGDPGDPSKGQSLPGARREALEVINLLKARQVEVVGMIGAPDKAGASRAMTEFAPASRLEVLRVLNESKFDLLHYAGHGDFDPADPENRAGWVFADGLLTSRELERVDDVPSLVVANACLSGLTSDAHAAGDGASRLRVPDDYLLPGLADEFFKRGVRNYVGTAWEINDLGAILFAKELYCTLLPDLIRGTKGETLGAALLLARKALKEKESSFGALWAAYQHYGDPGFRLSRD